MDLSGVQAFCIYEVAKIVVIRKDKDFIFVIFYIVTLYLKILTIAKSSLL